MTNLHLIAIPMTGVGVHGGFRGDAWYAHRIEIFKNYTLKSLANQSNQDFVVWMWFRPEEENNPLTKSIADALDKSGLAYIFTFNGLMYHDDKFTNYNLKTKLRNLAQMLLDALNNRRWRPLRELWKYTWEDKNKTLPKRLATALKTLAEHTSEDFDWVYLTRIDSDDMFHQDAVDLIQSQKPWRRRALVMDNGYMYNTETKQLAEWLPPTNPPFHTIMFPGKVFFSPEKHLAYYGDFRSHEDIPKVFKAKTLDMYKYCVTAHGKSHISTAWDVPLPKRVYQRLKYARPYCYTTSGKNISTRWQSRIAKKKNHMLGKEFTDPQEKREILAQFGITYTP